MRRRVRDLLARRAAASFVGRDQELRLLLDCVAGDSPLAVQIHGIAGVGKSSLLTAFASRARASGHTVIELDCRAIEPTERGFLPALGEALGQPLTTVSEAAAALERIEGRIVLLLDTYEVFRLMDTWLRQMFLPALGDNVRIVLAGRMPPVPAWLTSPEWHGMFRSVSLQPLSDGEAIELLGQAEVAATDAARLNRFARGHPLSLKLAAAAALARPDLELGDVAANTVVGELTRLFLMDVEDQATRETLEAVSVVRRITQTVLGALRPGDDVRDTYERLAAVPVIEVREDGLRMHDAVHEAIEATVRSADPSRHRGYRCAAWRQLRSEVRDAGPSELWRYTADMLYLIENPVVREAFFPSGSQELAVEPAREDDAGAIHEITRLHDTPEACRQIERWWKRLPGSFHVVRDSRRDIVGFYCMFDPAELGPADLCADPVTGAWWRHLRADPISKNQKVLFLRRWLGREHGEAPSPVQGACWLDVKRAYMELRPDLRRVYLTVVDLPTYAPVAVKLGFSPLDDCHNDFDGTTHHTAMLDFGPASVDGWIAGLVAAELEIEEGGILDLAARELVLDGGRVELTPLEFGVMSYLCQHEREAVSRTDLLQRVWGHDYTGGSNVVDAVVRTLRKKLGSHASVVSSVRGVGYRFERD